MVELFRAQARLCAELGSPMYAELLDRVTDDIEAEGVSADVLRGHEEDSGPSALALRLAGSVHRLVLSGQAPALAAYYPSVGGAWDLAGGWTAFEAVLRSQRKAVLAWLDQPPQTNEVGRSSALMGGLLRIGESFRLPVRLFEVGSSGGLNLRADRFHYTGEAGFEHGDPNSALRLDGAWQGTPLEPWPDLQIIERLGSDLTPVDVSTTEGRLTLTSYVWPDQTVRLARLEGALRIAEEVPAEVRQQDAASFARGIGLVEGTITVLWHSVMWQYLSQEDQQAVTAHIQGLGEVARESSPFAHLYAEPTRRTPDAEHEFLVVLRLWPGGERRVLGTMAPHGVPTVGE